MIEVQISNWCQYTPNMNVKKWNTNTTNLTYVDAIEHIAIYILKVQMVHFQPTFKIQSPLKFSF